MAPTPGATARDLRHLPPARRGTHSILADGGPFVSITRTADELSLVCPAERVPEGILADIGWRCLKVEGPFDLTSATGVLASIASPLAAAGVSVFAVATYDTDYILVTSAHLERAVAALTAAGHSVRR